MPQEDTDASEVDEAEEVLGVALIAGDQPAVVLEPGEQPFDLPAALVASQGSAVLSQVFDSRGVRCDQLDPPFSPQALV